MYIHKHIHIYMYVCICMWSTYIYIYIYIYIYKCIAAAWHVVPDTLFQFGMSSPVRCYSWTSEVQRIVSVWHVGADTLFHLDTLIPIHSFGLTCWVKCSVAGAHQLGCHILKTPLILVSWTGLILLYCIWRNYNTSIFYIVMKYLISSSHRRINSHIVSLISATSSD